MRVFHVICLVFAVLFALAAVSACVFSAATNAGMPPEEGATLEDGLAAIALGIFSVAGGFVGVVSGLLGAVFSAIGWKAKPRGIRIAFRVLLGICLAAVLGAVLSLALL